MKKNPIHKMIRDFVTFGMVVTVVTLLSSTTAKPKESHIPQPISDSVEVEEFIQTIDSLKFYVNKYEELKQKGSRTK